MRIVFKSSTVLVNPSSLACSLLTAILLLSGCSLFDSTDPVNEKKPEIFKVSFRQLPPEPVYNRVKFVYLPDVKPDSTKAHSNASQLDPLVKLSLKNNTLEQAAIALASLGNYHPYTASSIAKQKISLEAYGTLEEVAMKLATKSGVHIVVDHPNRQIRILKESEEESGVKPSFAQLSGSIGDEKDK